MGWDIFVAIFSQTDPVALKQNLEAINNWTEVMACSVARFFGTTYQKR
jgi:hypothetical protein